MSDNRPVALHVEDNRRDLEAYAETVKDKVTLLQAYNLDLARQYYDEYGHNLAFIVVDGKVEGRRFDTRPFIEHLVSDSFPNPIIGMSGDLDEEMIEAGCTMTIPKGADCFMKFREFVAGLL